MTSQPAFTWSKSTIETAEQCEIDLNLTIKTLEQHQSSE